MDVVAGHAPPQDAAPTAGPALRRAALDRLRGGAFDVLVVGGGINGAAAAAALSARGARVALVDRGDWAGATSQASSCLVWGGIKYLETAELGLVYRLCRARNRLLRAYPSAVRPVRFFAAHPRGFRRSLPVLLLGALLYWIVGAFALRRPRLLSRRAMAREEPAVRLDGVTGGLEYSDAYLPDGDARFTWRFVRAALDHGCAAANYVEVLGCRREGAGWAVRARDRAGGGELALRARVVVNACGPWADALNAADGARTAHRHVLSKGVHLHVDRLTPGERVLTFFADDGRLFFAIPMGQRTCLGTTDSPVEAPEVGVTAEDRRFILENVNARLQLARPLTEADILAERCGVRPLAVAAGSAEVAPDWVALSRRHVLEVDAAAGRMTLFGGKLTDCLNVGEEVCRAVARLGVALPWPRRRWYGEPPAAEREAFLREARRLGLGAAGAAGESPAERLWRRHGAAAHALLEAIRRDPRQADEVLPAAGWLRCELERAAHDELVVRLEDFLRRRTTLALTARPAALRDDRGVAEACRILFGPAAPARWAEYFGAAPAAGAAVPEAS